jgi:ubiquinone biosynthesis protein UbiJ
MGPELLRPFEQALNRQIAASHRARGLLAGLAGRSLEIRFEATPFRLRLAAGTEGLTVRPAADEPADAVIEGTPFSFLRLATGDAAQSIRAGGSTIHGDAEIAEAFRKLLDAARPDLEEELSRFAGDVAAHYLARFARDSIAFAERAGNALARNVGEYLSEESRDVPTRVELDEFLEGVDRLRESVDRLEGRIAAVARSRGVR